MLHELSAPCCRLRQLLQACSVHRQWQPSARSTREAASLLATSAGVTILPAVNASSFATHERDLWWHHPGLVVEEHQHPESLLALGEMYETGKSTIDT